MIYGNSDHPVEVRKIRLKIWKFRDELESIIQQRLASKDNDLAQVELSDLQQLYHSHITTNAQVLEMDQQDAEDLPHQKAPVNTTQSGKVLTIHRNRPRLDKTKLADGVVALIDLNMSTIFCFCEQNYLSGQVIIMEFLVPNHFFVTAEVLECRNYNMHSRIISKTRPSFRLHARWTYNLPGERTMLRRFLKSVRPEIPQSKDSKNELPQENSDAPTDKVADDTEQPNQSA